MNKMIESKRLLAVLKRKRMPKLETIQQVSVYVTRFMVKEYKLQSESDINCGYCFIWAYLVWALMKEPVKFVMNDGHVVIEYRGEYYDATTFGETEVNEIITGCGYDGDPQEFDVHRMAWYWARTGTRRKQFRELLEKTCESIYAYAHGEHGFWEDGEIIYGAEELSISDIP
jgi:hypothetical protein